jgi:hypothetical protein
MQHAIRSPQEMGAQRVIDPPLRAPAKAGQP